MKGLKFLMVILGLACLVLNPTYSLAVWDGEGDGFNVQVDIWHNDDTGSINIDAKWNNVEGASSYKVWVDQIDYATNGNSFEINVGTNGDFTFFVAAYDESGAELKRSDEFTVKLPSSKGKYIGKGMFSLESEYNYTHSNGMTWFGKETGSVNFLVYKETYIKVIAPRATETRYAVYGTGKVSFVEYSYGGGMSHDMKGKGTLSVLGVLFGGIVPGDVIPCTMFPTFTAFYSPVYQESCFGGECVNIQWPWSADYTVIGIPLQAGATYDLDEVLYGAVPRKVTFTLDELKISEPTECID
jgi:hypothetical protein